VALAVSAPNPTLWFVALSCFVIGLGMGLIAVPSLIAAQSSVEWNERGVVTGTNLFARSIGSAVGVAIFGALANAIFLAAGTETDVAVVEQASGVVFIGVAVAAVATVVAALAMPRRSRVAEPTEAAAA
jgi:MFS family permease